MQSLGLCPITSRIIGVRWRNSSLEGAVRSLRLRLNRLLRRLVRLIASGSSVSQAPAMGNLNALIDHVAYEIAAIEAAASGFSQTNAWPYLEAFLLHVRQVREFFWSSWDPEDRFAESAVLAEHYNPQWRNVRGGMPATLKRTRKVIDKQLAHITRERADSTFTIDLAAEVQPLQREIEDVWRCFLDGLPSEQRIEFEFARTRARDRLG